MSSEEYFHTCWNWMPEEVVSDEYWEKNEELFTAITNDMYFLHKQSNNFPPEQARVVLQAIFTNFLKFGLR